MKVKPNSRIWTVERPFLIGERILECRENGQVYKRIPPQMVMGYDRVCGPGQIKQCRCGANGLILRLLNGNDSCIYFGRKRMTDPLVPHWIRIDAHNKSRGRTATMSRAIERRKYIHPLLARKRRGVHGKEL